MACFKVQHSCMFVERDMCLLDTSHFVCLKILYLFIFFEGDKCLHTTSMSLKNKIHACLLKETSVFMRPHILHVLIKFQNWVL